MIYISTLAERQNDFILGSQQTVTYSKTIIETLEKGVEKNMDEILLQTDMNHSKVVLTEFRRCSLYVSSANQILEK